MSSQNKDLEKQQLQQWLRREAEVAYGFSFHFSPANMKGHDAFLIGLCFYLRQNHSVVFADPTIVQGILNPYPRLKMPEWHDVRDIEAFTTGVWPKWITSLKEKDPTRDKVDSEVDEMLGFVIEKDVKSFSARVQGGQHKPDYIHSVDHFTASGEWPESEFMNWYKQYVKNRYDLLKSSQGMEISPRTHGLIMQLEGLVVTSGRDSSKRLNFLR